MVKAFRRREKERIAAINLARKYVNQLVNQLSPMSAVLFGSYAKGDFNLWSDIDILIISDQLPLHPLERMDLLGHYVEAGIEPKGYRTEEFAKMLRKQNPIAVDAINQGIVIWDDGYWNSVTS